VGTSDQREARPLADAFLEGLGDGAWQGEGAVVEDALQALVDAGRNAWPGVRLSADTFVVHLAGLRRRASDPVGGLSSLDGGELWLACACLQGDAAAVSEFDRSYVLPLRGRLARDARTPQQVDDILQRVRERLLVGTGRAPARLASYGGSGSLKGWVRVVAVRVAVDVGRSERRHQAESQDEVEPAVLFGPTDDPELEYLKVRYQKEFRAAFGAALASLDPEMRTLLRLSHGEGLNVTQIGGILGTSRATAARRVASARRELLDATRRDLRRRLEITDGQLDSIIRLVRSRLEVTLPGWLEPPSSQ